MSTAFSSLPLSTVQWHSNWGVQQVQGTGAPDRGHNLFYLQDAKNQDSEETEIPLIDFLKDAPCLLTAFIFLFPKTLTDSSDEELCNMVATFVNKYSDDVSDDQCSF